MLQFVYFTKTHHFWNDLKEDYCSHQAHTEKKQENIEIISSRRKDDHMEGENQIQFQWEKEEEGPFFVG